MEALVLAVVVALSTIPCADARNGSALVSTPTSAAGDRDEPSALRLRDTAGWLALVAAADLGSTEWGMAQGRLREGHPWGQTLRSRAVMQVGFVAASAAAVHYVEHKGNRRWAKGIRIALVVSKAGLAGWNIHKGISAALAFTVPAAGVARMKHDAGRAVASTLWSSCPRSQGAASLPLRAIRTFSLLPRHVQRIRRATPNVRGAAL